MGSYFGLLRKQYVLFVGLLILLVAGMLLWVANSRLNDFRQYHMSIAEKSVTGVEPVAALAKGMTGLYVSNTTPLSRV
ncbi:MAG: hypothetical protein COB30_017525 [Ectothiorhodospiraceae bacterium]|nr:hypothetical protein [Ectothiorhodospiraceae bacterium]